MEDLTPKEQAKKLYEEFALIFHPLYHDAAIHLLSGEIIGIRCRTAKTCAMKAAETVRDSLLLTMRKEETLHWQSVCDEIENIKMPKADDKN